MASTETEVDFETRRWIWGTDVKKPRLLHVGFRVRKLGPALDFYVDGLGMKVIDRISIGPRRISVIFLGYADYDAGGLLELTCPWDSEVSLPPGASLNHISIGVPDVIVTVDKLEALGAEVRVPPTDYLGKGPRLAHVVDPDGHTVELIQTVRP